LEHGRDRFPAYLHNMVKIKIIAPYTDKYTNLQVMAGEVLEVSAERAEVLIGKGKAEIIQKEEKKAKATKQLKAKIKTK